MTITRAPRGMKHLSRGRLQGDEFDTMCDNPHCTDPICEGSCMVISSDGTVLQNLKGPRDPNACPSCWENPCGCHLLFHDDVTMPCMHCYGSPCRCEPADDVNPLGYLDDPGYDDYFYPNRDFYDPESRADVDGHEAVEDAIWAGELALMGPEERAEALRQDRIDMLGFDPESRADADDREHPEDSSFDPDAI